jgi:hypothetical protein
MQVNGIFWTSSFVNGVKLRSKQEKIVASRVFLRMQHVGTRRDQHVDKLQQLNPIPLRLILTWKLRNRQAPRLIPNDRPWPSQVLFEPVPMRSLVVKRTQMLILLECVSQRDAARPDKRTKHIAKQFIWSFEKTCDWHAINAVMVTIKLLKLR